MMLLVLMMKYLLIFHQHGIGADLVRLEIGQPEQLQTEKTPNIL